MDRFKKNDRTKAAQFFWAAFGVNGTRRELLLEAAAVSCPVMPGAIDRSRGVVEAVVQPDAIEVCQASSAAGAHAVFLAADRSFAAFQARALACVEASTADTLPDSLLLEIASLVDGCGMALHRRGYWCGLRKAKGGSKCQKSDAKQRNFHGVSP